MKKKVALLLAVVMVMALPMTAYAADLQEILDQIWQVNEEYIGGNTIQVEINDSGEATVTKEPYMAEFVPTDPNNTPNDPSDDVIVVTTPKYFNAVVTGSGLEGGYFTNNTQPEIVISPPANAVNLQSYAIVMVDLNTQEVHWMVTGIVPDAGTKGFTVGPTASADWAAAGYAGPETQLVDFTALNANEGASVHSYRIMSYALSVDNPFNAGDAVTLAEFNAAIEGKVISHASVFGLYDPSR